MLLEHGIVNKATLTSSFSTNLQASMPQHNKDNDNFTGKTSSAQIPVLKVQYVRKIKKAIGF